LPLNSLFVSRSGRDASSYYFITYLLCYTSYTHFIIQLIHSAQKITVARAKRLTGTYILVPQQSSLYYHIYNHRLIKLHAIYSSNTRKLNNANY